MNEYYTYAYLREDGTPYYIGKGKRYRINEQNGKAAKLPPIHRRIYLKTNLTEQEAFRHEIYMISVLGRKDLDTGILRNLTNGGEGNAGRVVDDDVRGKIREGVNKWYQDNEVKNSTREKLRQNWLGRKHSEQSKQLMSKVAKGRKFSEEHKSNLSKALTGREYSEEYKRNMEVATTKNTYQLTFSDGNVKVIKGLHRWCKDNGYGYVSVQYVKSGKRKYYKDIIKVEKLSK